MEPAAFSLLFPTWRFRDMPLARPKSCFLLCICGGMLILDGVGVMDASYSGVLRYILSDQIPLVDEVVAHPSFNILDLEPHYVYA